MVYTDIYIGLVRSKKIQHGDPEGRDTNFICSKNTQSLDRVVKEPGNHVLCNLQHLGDRSLVHEEVIHILEDTQVSIEWVSKWKS